MSAPLSATELLTQQFYDWERRGRGWDVWPDPVDIEPPFRPFLGHFLPPRSVVDDGQFETPLSRLATLFLGRPPAPTSAAPQTEVEPEPEFAANRDRLDEFEILVPPDFDPDTEEFEQLLLSLSLCREPIAFELISQEGQITPQFALHPRDRSVARQQFQAFFPRVAFLPMPDTLQGAWHRLRQAEVALVEFGLAHEFMRPLAKISLDPYISLVGALSELRADEVAVFQVIFVPARNPWADSVLRAVTDNEGDAFFVNAPQMVKEAQRKVSRPLYATVLRLATKGADFNRAWEIARNVAGALRVFCDPAGNELIPLTNDAYSFDRHELDLLRRQSHRSGMLLNTEELVGFVHLPSSQVSTPSLRRLAGKTKRVPAIAQKQDGLLLGHNLHAGESFPVRLSAEQRVRHCHIIGASGTGKSTLLFNLIRQDIEKAEGVAVLDPHGDLVDRLLGVIPPERVDDVVLLDPSDEEYSIGFNILSAHSELEKNLLASDLVSVFQRLSESWGDQMASVLNNAILAFLESNQGGTLADLRQFLLEPAFRDKFLETVRDPNVVYYWRKGFPQLAGNKSIGSVLTRLETFLSRKPIRHMVSQMENRLDFAQIMDSGKIFLAKLPEGLLGRENSYLLGALLLSKFQQIVMSRQAQQIAARRNFWLYIDEFANFITPSMAEILSGARKYRIGLTLAHHELHQLQRNAEVASAVMSHPFTRIVFKVSDDDAKKLGEGFAFFEAKDLRNLGTFQAIARVERSDFDFNLTTRLPEKEDAAQTAQRRQEVINASRCKYATPRKDVEAALVAKLTTHFAGPAAARPKLSPKPTPKSAEEPIPPVPDSVPAPGVKVEPVTPPADTDAEESQHTAIKDQIGAEAESLDYTVSYEEHFPAVQGRADIVLRRGSQTIVCQVTVTTPAQFEAESVRKFLKAGIDHIAVVSINRRKLNLIEQSLAESGDRTVKVGFYSPEELIAKLYDWAADDPEGGSIERGKPRKSKISLDAGQLPENERRQREKGWLDEIRKAMKR